jgi:hypothetical protein
VTTCTTNRAIAAAAISASSQEPPVMPPVVATAQAAAIEPAEAQTQATTNAVPPASLLPTLSPSHAFDDVIDYSTSDGMKLYSVSIAILPIKDFEGTGGNIQIWINDLIEHAQAKNWIAILTVVINGISYFIPRCFTLTIQQVQDREESYLFAPQECPKENSGFLYSYHMHGPLSEGNV